MRKKCEEREAELEKREFRILNPEEVRSEEWDARRKMDYRMSVLLLAPPSSLLAPRSSLLASPP